MNYFLTHFIFSTIEKLSTGNSVCDIIATFLLMTSINYITNERIRNNIFNKIFSWFDFNNKYNSITFSASDNSVSNRYRAIMHYISQKGDPSVKGFFEVELKKWNPRTNDDEVHTSIYRVSQVKNFNITENIKGRVYWYSKEKTEFNGKISYMEHQNLEITSKLPVKQLIYWVDSIEKEYKLYIKSKMLDTQTLVEVSGDSNKQNIDAYYTPWKSNVTFDNRFFTGKKEIIDQINFFINNEQWYIDRGIPYTLGILLWGEPGCGKTSFIKALMNLTKRHGVNIKLSKNMDMDYLRDVMCDDEITEDIIISQKNKLYIIEDIDAMGDIVKDRTLLKNNSEVDLEKKISDAIDSTMRFQKHNNNDTYSLISKINKNDNNNLSCLLNIFDGVAECSGRITVITTNYKDEIDEALIRPGRIDFKMHLTKATNYDIENIIKFHWNIDTELNINPDWSEKLSHAEITSCCRQSDNYLNTIKCIEKNISSIINS